jgi:hypothetical protein
MGPPRSLKENDRRPVRATGGFTVRYTDGMRLPTLAVGLMLAACSAAPSKPVVAKPLVDRPKPGAEFVARASDFDCILRTADKGGDPNTSWHKVRNFYLKNTMGRTAEALDVAYGRRPGPYPVGTVVQLVYMEAMVKRGGSFTAGETGGWEYFALGFDERNRTVIRSRGAEKTVNFAGLNCQQCHKKARPEFDFLCEQDHGCDPLPIGATGIALMQSGDPRCRN